jgi:hypothetical protein
MSRGTYRRRSSLRVISRLLVANNAVTENVYQAADATMKYKKYGTRPALTPRMPPNTSEPSNKGATTGRKSHR